MSNRAILSAVLLSFLAAPSACAQRTALSPPHSVEELADRYRTAHSRKDVEAIRQLFYWGASTQETRMAVTSFINSDVAHAIQAVTVKPPTPTDPTEYEKDGVKYRMTLPAIAKLVIDFQPRSVRGGTYKSEQTGYLIGVRNGEYWLVTSEPSR